MKKFPFLSLSQALFLLRIALAVVFIAHAAVRISGGTIERFAGFLANKGFPLSTVIVWLITIYELGGSLLLIAGRFTRRISLGFILILLAGIFIIHIHADSRWFVGEHGTGGSEYSFILIMAFVVIAAGNREKTRIAQ